MEESNTFTHIDTLLSNRRLLDAIKEICKVAKEKKYNDMVESCGRLEEEYRRMLYFLQEGVNDTARGAFYNDYIVEAYTLLDSIKRNSALNSNFSLYYSQYRTEISRNKTISDRIREFKKICDSTSIFNVISEGKTDESNSTEIKERSFIDLFNAIWITFPLKAGDKNELLDLFNSEAIPEKAKVQLVPALLLSVLEYFDSNKVELLIDLYCSFASDLKSMISSVALTSLLISLLMYGSRPVKSTAVKKLKEASVLPMWNEDVKNVLFELIKTIDTERIGEKIQKEILPELQKAQKDINKFFSDMKVDEETFDISSLEENPEWMESLQNSKLSKKMQEIFKIQSEGGDIFMSAFNQLKTFPFFNEISNWFAPFSEDSSVIKADDDSRKVAQLIEKIPNVCDSDKYSIMLLYSGSYMPQSQKDSILNQVKMNNLNISGIEKTEAVDIVPRKSHITNYVQNLYRFFKLYRRKGEFNNPFENPFDIAKCKHLPLLGNAADTEIELIAEYYFKHKYYDEALKLFLYLEKCDIVNAQNLQKAGFCYQLRNDIENALVYYKKADLMESGSTWTVKRIVQCLQLLNKHREALEYIEDLCITNPDDTKVLIQKAKSLIATDKLEKSISILTKVAYLEPDNISALRLLSYSQYRLRKFDASMSNLKKIVSSNPQACDYLVMGNISMAMADFKEAINCYELASERDENGIDGVIDGVKSSAKELEHLGVDTSVLPMILDCLIRL